MVFTDSFKTVAFVPQSQAAQGRLAAADAMLAGERGAGRLRRLKRALIARRARMIAQLAAALGLGFHTGMPCVASPLTFDMPARLQLPPPMLMHVCTVAAHPAAVSGHAHCRIGTLASIMLS